MLENPHIKSTLVVIFSFLFIGVLIFYKLEYIGSNKPTGMASENITVFFSETEITVDPDDVFTVDLLIDARDKPVSAIDIKFDFSESDIVEIQSITPDYTTYPVYLPADQNGAFDETTAIDNLMFGAVSYDWNSQTPEAGITGENLKVATLEFRALTGGNITLSLESGIADVSESNMIQIDTLIVADILEFTGSALSICVVDCDGKVCGDDGCGGSCGECTIEGQGCVDGACICIGNCVGRECGDDGCGGSCGTCRTGTQCKDYECIPAPTPSIDDDDGEGGGGSKELY